MAENVKSCNKQKKKLLTFANLIKNLKKSVLFLPS